MKRGLKETEAPGTSAICSGLFCRASAAAYGCIALAWKNNTANRIEMRCGEVGVGDGSDGKLKADVWYELDADGHFSEITD